MYKVPATYNGQSVTFVEISQQGQIVYLTYITSGGNLVVEPTWANPVSAHVIATGATAP